jgi:hypothetical protein
MSVAERHLAAELAAFVRRGMKEDDTAMVRAFRARLKEILRHS